MKRLTCEMCGSTDLVKQDGVFVCQACGCKYSVEEARKMMIEWPVEVTGTVKVDNSASVESYLSMARAACLAGNYGEAESYCNKSLEIEPAHAEAWLLKGKAAGWQTTALKSRLPEAVSSFTQAIGFCPEEKKESMLAEIRGEFVELALAAVSLHGRNFSARPNQNHQDALIEMADEVSALAGQLGTQLGIRYRQEDLIGPMADLLHTSAIDAYREIILPAYKGNPNDPNDKPGKYRFQDFINRGILCSELIEKATMICAELDARFIPYLKDMIVIHRDACSACSWKTVYQNGRRVWEKEYMLLDSAKAKRREAIEMFGKEITRIEREIKNREQAEKEKRIAAFWAVHEEEKTAYEAEKRQLEEQIGLLKKEQEEAGGYKKLEELRAQIKELNVQINGLGVFRKKEKNALQEKVKELYGRIDAIKEEGKAACDIVQTKIDWMRSRINQIESELTKDRPQ